MSSVTLPSTQLKKGNDKVKITVWKQTGGLYYEDTSVDNIQPNDASFWAEESQVLSDLTGDWPSIWDDVLTIQDDISVIMVLCMNGDRSTVHDRATAFARKYSQEFKDELLKHPYSFVCNHVVFLLVNKESDAMYDCTPDFIRRCFPYILF